ncbi:hypothetical protein Egran_05902 [Elaphomyces granulatus]|uniref:Dynactin subunit n=1 Tax=Elaphomyces granulatus TaxID=519963 RepID=A0A232LQA2_9EURO|nr:hypothetical protein Egran_05902 [Elaphomyces granulatus]
MSLNKKYANLPDLDLAPDIYETPDLTDEVSTLPQTTTVRTNVDSDNEALTDPNIDRHGLNAEEARSHFLRATVDTRDVDFSDTIATKRKAYRSKSRLRRRRGDAAEELRDFSDSDEETFERKLARLRREAEELKDELARRKEVATVQQEAEADKETGEELLELSRALDDIHAFSRGAPRANSADVVLWQKLTTGSRIEGESMGKIESAEAATTAVTSSSGLLTHAASFDARLTLVEAAMGVSTTSNPFITENNTEPLQPVLPALDHLTSRLVALTSTLTGGPPQSMGSVSVRNSTAVATTTPHVEALTTRIKKLTADADALANAHKRVVEAAKAAQTARIAAASADYTSNLSASSSSATEVDPAASQRDEQAAKIQALYATLPTIQSLHPLLPSVLERLRSLRSIHAGAAHAGETLDALEKRQLEMQKDIEQWQEGLRVVEEKVREGEVAMKKNIDVVSPWVKALEARLSRLEIDR